jgi:hypothetical protein
MRPSVLLLLLALLPLGAADQPAEAKPAVETRPAAETTPTAEAKPAAEATPAPQAEAAPAADAKPAEVKPAEAGKPAEPAPAGTGEAKPPTDEQIAAIRWEEFSADNTWVCPFAVDFSRNEEFPERKTDWEDFLAKFALWAPGHVPKPEEKVRNLLCAAALMDIGQGQFESELPLFVYQRLRREVPDDKLKTTLAMTAFHPDLGSVISTAPELSLDIGVGEDQVRERLQILAVKMLGRMLGKLPMDHSAP